MCGWVANAGHPSPNRLDALVWAITDLMLGEEEKTAGAWGRR
jgi:phage terminase large subunit-like protein